MATQRLSKFLQDFSSQINGFAIKQSDLDTIYNLADGLVSAVQSTCLSLIEDSNGFDPSQVLDLTSSLVSNHFDQFKSRYKRDKMFTSHPLYVAPTEIGIGTRFELKKDEKNNSTKPQRIQSTFEYVSIVDTIKSLFKREEFKKLYFEYNSQNENGHKCVDGVYEHFCCGSRYKSTEVFQTNKHCLQIQIATDEYEPCSTLQSKTGLHKSCAVYFIVRNMPTKFLSKLKNIYLVCLVNSNDLKTKQTDFNNIWEAVVKDIKYLETNGIEIDGFNVKGALVYLSFDNLGGNNCLGLVESFQAFFYCRICQMPKELCQHAVEENPKMLRNRNDYKEQLKIIEASESVNYSQTKGIKRLCVLNKLDYFHIVENISVDIMHDLNEGVIPFLLKHFFKRCIRA